jgi:hypothetical protein
LVLSLLSPTPGVLVDLPCPCSGERAFSTGARLKVYDDLRGPNIP